MENREREPNYYADIIAAQAERTTRRLWILCILLIVLLVATNSAWLWYESQFTDEVTTIEAEQTSDGGGNNYVVGGDFGGEAEG